MAQDPPARPVPAPSEVRQAASSKGPPPPAHGWRGERRTPPSLPAESGRRAGSARGPGPLGRARPPGAAATTPRGHRARVPDPRPSSVLALPVPPQPRAPVPGPRPSSRLRAPSPPRAQDADAGAGPRQRGGGAAPVPGRAAAGPAGRGPSRPGAEQRSRARRAVPLARGRARRRAPSRRRGQSPPRGRPAALPASSPQWRGALRAASAQVRGAGVGEPLATRAPSVQVGSMSRRDSPSPGFGKTGSFIHSLTHSFTHPAL